jgi:hypothetical protein
MQGPEIYLKKIFNFFQVITFTQLKKTWKNAGNIYLYIHLFAVNNEPLDVAPQIFSQIFGLELLTWPATKILSSGIYRRVSRWHSSDVSEEITHHLLGRRELTSACCLLQACFLLGLLFDPKDGGDMFLGNISWLTDNMALYPRRQNSP